MAKAYQYYKDGFYFCEAEDHGRLPANATHIPPPPGPWHNLWPKFVDGAWVMVEDHRERSAALFGEHAQEATEYWLPDDTWEMPGRRMQKPGPLPAGAKLARPKKSEAELLASAKEQKLDDIEKAYEAALTASITMPIGNPTPSDVAVHAALFAAEDAEGLDFLASRHGETRDKLASRVMEASTSEDVEEIAVRFAV